MAKAMPTKTRADQGPNDVLKIAKMEGESLSVAIARAILDPDFRSGMAIAQLMKPKMDGGECVPGMGDYADVLGNQADAAAKGNLGFASRMLATQATVLDTIFIEMARRMALNAGEYISPTETYSRIALRAQSNCRATLEALAKLHQPREQTVRHVHVNEGGQAVIADQFHHHQTGGPENGQSIEQPLATGTGAAGTSPALPCPDPIGQGVPVPSGEG